MTARVALLGAIAITALVVGSGFSEDATPNAPTNVAGVPWRMRLAEFQKARPNAQCQSPAREIPAETRLGRQRAGASSTTWSAGPVTTIRPVTFRATCEEPMSGPEAGPVLFFLEGNPPLFTSAYLTFQRPDYPSTVEAERLIWRRPSATVTLSSAEYAHLGRKSGATTLLLSATRP